MVILRFNYFIIWDKGLLLKSYKVFKCIYLKVFFNIILNKRNMKI